MVEINNPIGFVLVVLGLVLGCVAEDGLFELVLLSQARGAACLDGSPIGIYVHQGQGENKNNYLIYFQGGGFCGQPTLSDTLQSCYKRSFTNLGSSKSYPKTMNGSKLGAVSPYKQQNPLFYDWTLIIPKYCDGNQYMGYRENPIEYKDRELYFRGSANVKEIFYYLDWKYRFYDGGKIGIAGGSAGGIGAYQWVSYVAENTRKAKVYGHPDSGFFITDYYSPLYKAKKIRQQITPLLNLAFNRSQASQPVLKCVQNPQFDLVDCLNIVNYVQFIKAPLLIVQSPYDAYSVANIVGTLCPTNPTSPYSLQSCNQTELSAIEDYRLKSVQSLKSLRSLRKNIGIWAPACVQHSFQHITRSYNSQDYRVKGVTLMEALRRFYDNGEDVEWLMDQMAWPGNLGCSGLRPGEM